MPAHLVRPRPVTTPAAVGVLRRAALPLLGRLPLLADRLTAELAAEEPAYRAAIETDPAGVRREVRRSLRHSVGSLLDPAGSRAAARACSARIGADRASDGMPLDAVLHAFRLGGALVWQALVDEVTARHPEDAHLLVHLAADVWSFVDEHCTCVADAYRRAEHELTRRREDRRRLRVAALLDGSTRIAELPDVAAELELPERGRYAVVLVAGGRGVLPGGLRAVWHPGPDGQCGIVLLAGRTSAALAAACRESTARTPGLRIGISPAVEGLTAIGAARRLAGTALRICPAAGGTVLLDEDLPAALVAATPVLGRLLADRVLGPLLALPPADRDVLLDTLTVWLDCDGSAQRAATRLYCHRNTVLNRLRRCEQLTGLSLTRPGDLVELGLALSAHRLRRP
ncbi:CdaR family transcriptional regulator [Streptomyces sp. VRA16 Mangrove soil]|uniref:PucR family transcriptional regulator n=1 Tax=Streptomyces sp. VRA16 Mangrove soil TaxID=2817434 RepID=UPI001A9FAE36|nr:helix-turn-helix domain-containing protein [Streptomyces sp. VRA16 Mangrove soil]MBO1333457.1 helix-turn-helix domain-containing protein [Streptomyces sp. VRA16 Mangrove soil]